MNKPIRNKINDFFIEKFFSDINFKNLNKLFNIISFDDRNNDLYDMFHENIDDALIDYWNIEKLYY